MKALVKEHMLSSTYHKQFNQFGSLYQFKHEDWFEEFSNMEYAYFYDCIELIRQKPEEFLALLVNRKKRQALMNKHERLKVKKQNFTARNTVVQQYFSPIPFNQLMQEFMLLPQLFDYQVEESVGIYYIGKKLEDTYCAFTASQLNNDKLSVEIDGEQYEFSTQALMYFMLANEMVHQVDAQRIMKCKCDVKEAVYAVSYSKSLLEPFLIHFFIMPADNSITSFLIAHIMYTKTIRFMQDAIVLPQVVATHYNEELIDQLNDLKVQYSHITNSAYFFYTHKNSLKLQKREQQQVQKYNELERKFDNLKEKYDQELDKKRALKSELQEQQQIETQISRGDSKLREELVTLRASNKQLKDDKKDLEREGRKIQRDLSTKFESLQREHDRLKNENSQLQQQVIAEKRNKIQSEELSFEQWLEKGKGYLASMSTSQEQALQNFVDIANDFLQEQQKQRPKQSLTTNKVGYCMVTETGHYARFANGDTVFIENLPSNVYLSNHQFVELTIDHQFVQALHAFYYDGSLSNSITHFAIAVNRNDQAFIKVDGKLQSVQYKENVQIRDGQVISVNQNFELVYYYQARAVTLDDLYPSIRLQGHTPYYVELVLDNGYVLRDLQNHRVSMLLQERLVERSFVVLQGDESVTFRDDSSLCYKKSAFYKQKQLASVSEIDEDVYALKQNEEYVILQYNPAIHTFELGDMVWIDEHNALIERVVEDVDVISTETIEQKLLSSNRLKVTRQHDKLTVEKNVPLLIIGNIRLSERYKKYFGEFGYLVEVVDGTGPYEKIRQACVKHDLILYSTSFTKHKHSGKMSVDITKPYILCDSTSPQVMRAALLNTGV